MILTELVMVGQGKLMPGQMPGSGYASVYVYCVCIVCASVFVSMCIWIHLCVCV